MKSIRGRNWGCSEKLLLITYKVLVRSIIDYCPFIPLVISNSNLIDLERIQRKAIRIARRLHHGTPIRMLYDNINIIDLKTRAIDLSDKYLFKAVKYNILIIKTVEDYNLAGLLDEGLHCTHLKKRKSLLGILATTTNLKSNQLFKKN